MEENLVGKMVKKAKGDDRTLREYSRDSGVNVAIISKIINGTYVPKKTDVYRALTSAKAAPRGGVTYKQLIDAVDSSKSYQSGVLAGMAFAEMALKSIGGLPLVALGAGASVATGMISAKRKGEIEKADNDIERQRFVAIANGIIYGKLGAKGVSFKIDNNHKPLFNNQFDTYLTLDNQEVTEYIFRYAYITEEQQQYSFFIENIPRRLIEELVFKKASNKLKVTIVTNCEKSYDYMLSYKDELSYNGELSIMIVDEKRVELLREDYISHYSGGDSIAELNVI